MSRPLDPELAALAAAAAGSAPITTLTVEEARDRVDAGVVGATAGPPLYRVHDALLESAGRRIPVRSYVPREGAERVLVYAHGGGWVTGDLNYADAFCRHLSSRADAVVVSVDYRRAPEHRHPAAVEDVFDVIAQTSKDGRPLAIAGDSAGGHLVALAAIRAARAQVRVDFQVLIYPVTRAAFESASYVEMRNAFPLSAEAMRWFWEQYAPAATAADPEVFPHHAELAGVAPTYVVSAGHDPLHDDATGYAQHLRESGVEVTEDDFATLSHGFLRFTRHSAAARGAQEVICATVNGLFGAVEGGNSPHRD